MDRTPESMRSIRTVEDVLRLMDGLFAPGADRWTDGGGADWWDRFYADRSRGVPFFVARPDESLASWLDDGAVTLGARGRALDLGCGAGRNTLLLARHGFTVDAVDLSPKALAWARERAEDAGAGSVAFHRADAFALTERDLDGPYDLIYDSGCFHHLPPHRRVSYLAFLDRFLAPGGAFGLSCFAVGSENSGSELSDLDLYREARLHGGVAYGADDLRWIFSDLTEAELRRMRKPDPASGTFGEPFLWAALFRKAGPLPETPSA
ncbi:class I SAM-dependent methyltransferase [Streptomyces sp. NPDC005012]|uniref:class I SAM-dependent methyltransferase n=1 Tax=unclassified Streptomyces TaxID=2593676 RepID=UPI0033BCE1B6